MPTGLTHAALVGQRKQSVQDAERLLSDNMATFMKNHNHMEEATFIERVSKWHQASDGRGLSQRQRSEANYKMLNYILDVWMPWHTETYDFSTIDINRYVIIYNIFCCAICKLFANNLTFLF